MTSNKLHIHLFGAIQDKKKVTKYPQLHTRWGEFLLIPQIFAGEGCFRSRGQAPTFGWGSSCISKTTRPQPSSSASSSSLLFSLVVVAGGATRVTAQYLPPHPISWSKVPLIHPLHWCHHPKRCERSFCGGKNNPKTQGKHLHAPIILGHCTLNEMFGFGCFKSDPTLKQCLPLQTSNQNCL